MKRFAPFFAVTLMICSILFGSSIFNVMAEEPESAQIYRYYKSLEIQDGESLWSIATRYNTHDQMTIKSYIKELKAMNGLKQDTIHAGQHLTVLYFSESER